MERTSDLSALQTLEAGGSGLILRVGSEAQKPWDSRQVGERSWIGLGEVRSCSKMWLRSSAGRLRRVVG